MAFNRVKERSRSGILSQATAPAVVRSVLTRSVVVRGAREREATKERTRAGPKQASK